MARKNYLRSSLIFLSVVLGLVLTSRYAKAQAPSPVAEAQKDELSDALIQHQKEKFLAATKELMKALEGKFCDEGNDVWRALESMHRALLQWDETIRAFENAVASKFRDAGSHVALGKVYLDRYRLDDAIRELAAAAQLELGRADAHTLQGLAYSHAGKYDEALQAFRKALARDPTDPTASYMVAQSLMKLGHEEAATKAVEYFSRVQQKRLEMERHSGAVGKRFKTGYKGVEGPAELLEEAAGLGPAFMAAGYSQGLALLKQGKFEQAIAGLEKAAASDPLSASAYLYVSGSYGSPDKLAQALKETRRAVTIHRGKHAKDLNQLGEIYLALGQKDRARSTFEEALKSDQSFFKSRLNIGSLALRDGKVQEGLRHFKLAAELNPNYSEARRCSGMAYWADGQYDKSVDEFKAAVRLSPLDERARVSMTALLISAARFNDAEQALQDAIHAIPDSGLARYSLGRLYFTQGKRQQGLEEIEEAIKVGPLFGLDKIYRMTGRVYLMQAKLDDAITAYRKALDVNPSDLQTHMDLGDIKLQQNRSDEALAEFLAAVVSNPDSAEPYVGIGQVHLRMGRYVEAAEASKRALELNPEQGRARYTLGMALLRLGKSEEAKKELQQFQQKQAEVQAEEHSQRELAALKQQAAASLKEGEYDNVIALLRKAIEYEPYLGTPYVNLGEALIKAGRYEEAVKSFQKALELRADFPDVHRYLAEAYKALGRLKESEREKASYERMKAEQIRKAGESH